MQPTITDIARLANVSPTTVSNVIHGRNNRVSENKKLEILKIIEELNYQPNLSARTLVTRESRVIGLVFYGIDKHVNSSDPFVGNFIATLQKKAAESNFYIMLINVNKETTIDSIIKQWDFAGILAVGFNNKTYSEFAHYDSTPIIFIDTYLNNTRSKHHYFIYSEDEKASYEASKWLINEYDTVGMICPDYSLFETGVIQERISGYSRAIEEDRLENQIFSGSTPYEMKINFDKVNSFLVFSDILAIQLHAYARSLSKDYKINTISFDNISLGEWNYPKLSTIDIQQKKKAILAFDLLQKLIQGEVISKKEFYLESNLILRDST